MRCSPVYTYRQLCDGLMDVLDAAGVCIGLHLRSREPVPEFKQGGCSRTRRFLAKEKLLEKGTIARSAGIEGSRDRCARHEKSAARDAKSKKKGCTEEICVMAPRGRHVGVMTAEKQRQ
jgi:hypothetical protein